MTSRSSQVTGTRSRRAVLGVRAMPSARLSWPVACADYAVAEPDLWEAFAATVTEHLDTDHATCSPTSPGCTCPGGRWWPWPSRNCDARS